MVVVASPSEVIEGIVDFVGIAVEEEVSVGAKVQANGVKNGVHVACSSTLMSGVSQVEFVIFTCRFSSGSVFGILVKMEFNHSLL